VTFADFADAVNQMQDRGTVLLTASYLLLGAAAGAHALLNKAEPRAAQVWLIVCLFVPILGAMAYFAFGVNRIQTRARRLHEPLRQTPGESSDLSRETLRQHGPYLVLGNRVADMAAREGNEVGLLFNGDEAYPAMLDAINHARTRVLLCSYIFDNDAIGQQFVTALKSARDRGLEVRVLVDAVGELYSWPRITRALRRAGIIYRRFLPPRWVPPFGYVNLRTHRKLLIVDGEMAFCGGMNIGERHIADPAGVRAVDDVHFLLEGPVVIDLEWLFLDDWRFASGETLKPGEPASVAGSMVCRVIPDGPNEDLDKLLFILHGAIAHARESVLIMTPYFLPERDLIVALQTAALRGVEVKIVVPARSNLPYVDWAMQHLLPQLLARGVRVFRRETFSHAKLFVVDGRYALIGSANIDPRSLRLNFEVGVEVFDATFAAAIEAVIRADTVHREETVGALLERGRLRRLRDAAMSLFTPYL
jgi:cardiolipin synthase A/B